MGDQVVEYEPAISSQLKEEGAVTVMDRKWPLGTTGRLRFLRRNDGRRPSVNHIKEESVAGSLRDIMQKCATTCSASGVPLTDAKVPHFAPCGEPIGRPNGAAIKL